MERRVDFDDLLALAYVLRIAPADLMVSKDAVSQPYPVTSTIEADSDIVREWIRGEELLVSRGPFMHPDSLVMLDAIRWMPDDRAQRVGRRYFEKGDQDHE